MLSASARCRTATISENPPSWSWGLLMLRDGASKYDAPLGRGPEANSVEGGGALPPGVDEVFGADRQDAVRGGAITGYGDQRRRIVGTRQL